MRNVHVAVEANINDAMVNKIIGIGY